MTGMPPKISGSEVIASSTFILRRPPVLRLWSPRKLRSLCPSHQATLAPRSVLPPAPCNLGDRARMHEECTDHGTYGSARRSSKATVLKIEIIDVDLVPELHSAPRLLEDPWSLGHDLGINITPLIAG